MSPEFPPSPPPQAPPPPRARRILTGPLLAWAALLGVVAGVGVGYGVQAHRSPAALPPLVGKAPAYSLGSAADAKPPVVTVGGDQDLGSVTAGDLSKALLPVPSGASDQTGVDVWFGVADHVSGFGPDAAARFIATQSEGFRRSAYRDWTAANGDEVQIELAQYSGTNGAEVELARMHEDAPSGETTTALPGTADGKFFTNATATAQSDGSRVYIAMAAFVRGEVLGVVWFTSARPVDAESAMQTVSQQVARL